MSPVRGKVVVVTGAARGQGAGEAEALTSAGARVIATDVDPVGDCRRLDVTSDKEWAALAAELRETYGRVHGLVNNAGITWRSRAATGRPWSRSSRGCCGSTRAAGCRR